MKSIKFFILSISIVCISLASVGMATQVVEPPKELPAAALEAQKDAEKARQEEQTKGEDEKGLSSTKINESTLGSSLEAKKKITQKDLVLPLALMPYLEYYIDREAKMNISSVSDAAIVSTFKPYLSLDLPNTQGLVWLRIPFDKLIPNTENNTYVLDLGDNLQGLVKAWYKENPVENISGIITDASSYAKNNALLLTMQAKNRFAFKNVVNLPTHPNEEEQILTGPSEEESELGINKINLEKGGYIYIAIEGLPSLWFAPFLVNADSYATNPYSIEGILENSKLYLLLATAFLSFLCFLRAIKEKRGWRFWSGVFGLSGAALAYFGIPATPAGTIIPANLQSIFALSATLFSLMLVGRYCMSLLLYAKRADFFFLLLSLLGVALSLLPFIPSFAWLVRYIELWPLLCGILLIPTFYLMIKNIKASARYFLVLLILFLTEAVALLGIGGISYSKLWTNLPIFGLFLAVFFLLISPTIHYSAQKNDNRKNVRKHEQGEKENDFALNTNNEARQSKSDVEIGEVITKPSLSMHDNLPTKKEKENAGFNLKLDNHDNKAEQKVQAVKQAELKVEKTSESLSSAVEQNVSSTSIPAQVQEGVGEVQNRAKPDADIWYDHIDFSSANVFARIEQSFRVSLDTFMHQVYFLEQQVMQVQDLEQRAKINDHVQKILSIGKDISTISTSLPKLVLNKPMNSKVKVAFNLQDLLKQVYEKVRYEASAKQIALSWFCAPHLGLWYVGEKDALASLLYQLLSDSIRATQKGLVYVNVKRDETSNNYGRLQFTIGDSGKGQPPNSRASSLLSKIWEITASHHGDFKVETTDEGIEYSFVLAFIALEEDGETEKRVPLDMNTVSEESQEIEANSPDLQRDASTILVVAEASSQRYLLSFKLEKIQCHVLEAMDLDDCYVQYTHAPSGIIVLDAHLNEDTIADFIARIRTFEGENSLPHVLILSLSRDEVHKEYLLRIGSDYVLDQNIRRFNLREKVQEYLNEVSNPQYITAKGMKLEEILSFDKQYDEKEEKKQELRLHFSEEDEEHMPSMLPTKEEDESEGVTKIFIPQNQNVKEVDNFYPNYNKVIDLPSMKENLLQEKEDEKEEAKEIPLTEAMVSYETYPEEEVKEENIKLKIENEEQKKPEKKKIDKLEF